MKHTAKRILAMLCVTVMLFTCCMSGLTFAVSADIAEGGTTAYGNKWTIHCNAAGTTLSYASGGRFEKAYTGFNAQIPTSYEMEDIALYIHMTLDSAAVTAFEKGGSVELSQSSMDKSERNWSLTAPEWKVGENIILLPLSASGNSPGGADPFDLHQPINFFRMFANPGSAEFAAASTVTIWEIALVDKTEAGVTFGADDTYLSLSEPLTSTPNSIEASVKVDPMVTEIPFGINFAPRYTTTTLDLDGDGVADTDADGNTVYVNKAASTTVTGVEGIVDGTEAFGCTMPVGGYLGSKDTKLSITVPKAYKAEDMALAFWFYTSTGTVPNTVIELTSSGQCDKQEMEWTTNAMFTDLQVGWNYIEMPLSSANHNQNGGAFDLQGANFLRLWGSGKATEEMTVYFTDWKLVKLADEEEEEVPAITEWPMCNSFASSSGFNIGWSSTSSNAAFGKVWATDATMSKQPVAGTTYVEFTAKGNTASSGVWSPVFTHTFTALDIPEGVTLNDLKFSMWMYISDASALATPSPNFKIGSTASSVDQGLSYSGLFTKNPLVDGWNYIEFPLSEGTLTDNPLLVEDICKMTMRSLNLTWLDSTPDDGVAGTVADQAIVRYADFKISLIEKAENEWSIGYPNGGRYSGMTNIGTGTVGAGEDAPEGTKYYAVKVDQGVSWAMAHQSFSVEFPTTVAKEDLFLSFWMYTSTGEVGTGNIELTSSGTWDKQEITFTYKNYIPNLKAGWNYVELPLASPTAATSGTPGVFDYTKANFIRWVGGSTMAAETEIRISEMKFIAKSETYAENEQALFPTTKLGATTWSDGSDGLPSNLPYVSFDRSASGGASLVTQQGLALDIPANTQFGDLGFSFWLWVNDVDNITGVGQIELTSSGTCDQQELYFTLDKSKLQDGWNHVYMPFVKGSRYDGTNGVTFDHTAINYFRWYGLYGANLQIKLSHFALYNVESIDTPTWPILNLNKNTWNWDGGKITTGNIWMGDGTAAAQPAPGTVYMEVTPGTGVADIDGDGTAEAWKAGFNANTGGQFVEPHIPTYYDIADLSFSFWLYVPDVDLLPLVAGAPNFQLTSAGTYDKQHMYYSYLLRDGIQGEWKDGWNYIELPLSKMGKNAAFDLYNLNFMRWSYFPMYYSADENVADVVRYADFRITSSVDKTPQASEEVGVTADDCIIFGNTNTDDENPITLFTDVYGNVSWVWGDKQYTTDFNVCTGEWIDLALVRDMDKGLFILYADGEVVAECDATGTEDIIPTVAHTIGADGLGVPFVGMIADVRVWSDVRTAEEIAANRVAKVGVKTSPLTADEEGLIDAWFLVGNLNYVLGGTVTDSVKGNDLVFMGSRADDWEIDYEIPTDVVGEDYYSMVFIPDTQELVTGAFTDEWMAAAQWIADNVEKENIVHVIGAGDTTWLANDANFTIAKNGWDLFTSKVSWSNMTGNHDYPGSTRSVNDTTYIIRDSSKHNEYFSFDYIQSTAAANTYVGSFKDDYDIYGTEADENGKYSGTENSYYRFKVNGVQWMILQLEYHPRVSVINWANEILEQYPNDNVIFTTHGYIGADNGRYSTHWMPYTKSDAEIGGYIGELMPSGAVAWPGGSEEPIWTEILYKHDNVKMLLCGHDGTTDGHVLTRWDENVAGNMVPQVMMNAQDLDVEYFQGQALAMLGILRFSADGTKCEIQYYSPYHDASYHPSNQEMRSLTLTTKSCAHETTVIENKKDATCTVDGYTGDEICSDCGELVKKGEVIAAAHTIEDKAQIDATCTENGVTAGGWCSVCKQYITGGEIIEATGHNEVTETVDATCTENGSITVTCDVCGEVLSSEIIEATGHNEVTTTVDATCTENGSITVKCDVCGEVLSTEIIEAAGHNEVTTTVDATCTENGSVTVTCDVCGETLSVTVIEATGHDEGTLEGAYDPTLTEPGYEGDVICGKCGDVITAGAVIPTLTPGVIDENGYYREDGKRVPYKGLILVDGEYYYVNDHGLVLKDVSYTILDTNGYESLDARIQSKATYYFDANGHMIFEKNGIFGGVYYENDKKVPYAGLVEVDGNLYYVVEKGNVVTGRYFISNLNEMEGFSNGYYFFDENGVMNTAAAVVDGYYYADGGKCTAYAGLVEVDGDYYYVLAKGEVKLGRYSIVKHNDLKAKGLYCFGADGKMVIDGVYDGYYYNEEGKSESYLGLVEAADGNYYYVQAQGKVVANADNFFVTTTNGLVAKGRYAFDENGAMLLVDTYEELIDALKNNSYVSLAGDITVNGNISLPAGATLNGNGYTLKAAQLYMGEGSTVRRVVFDGTALVDGSNIYAHDVSVTIDTCTFKSPDFDAIQATTKVAGVTVVINSCTFLDDADTAYRYVHVELVEALRGDADNGVKLVLTNNKFYDIDSCDNDGITVAGVLAENLTVSGNTATAASAEAANAECWFGERTTGAWVTYDVAVFDNVEQAATAVDTAEELTAALAEGGSVKLVADVVLTDEPIVLAQDTVLDLGGNTLTGRSTEAAASNLITVPTGKTLTLKNGTVTFEAGSPDTDWGENGSKPYPGYANNTINCRGTLIVDGATILNTTAKGGASYAIDCYAGADLIVNSGLIDGGDKIAIRMFAGSATTATSVTINGGTVQGYRAVWVQLPSSDAAVAPIANLTVNGGNLISTDTEYNQVVYVYSYGNSFSGTTIELNGGNYYGDVALGGGGLNGVKTGMENVTVNEENVKLYGAYGVYSYNDAANIEVLPNA